MIQTQNYSIDKRMQLLEATSTRYTADEDQDSGFN